MAGIMLEEWENPEEVLLSKLLKDKAYRETEIETEWMVSENALEDAGYDGATSSDIGQVHPTRAKNDGADIKPNTNYLFKQFRLLHSQMSANPPTVGTSPLTMDQSDRDSAEAAESVMMYWHKHANLQENVDQTTYKVLKYGTGYLKTIFDPNLGDMLDFDESSDMVTMEGDASVYSPSTWDVWLDSTAMRAEDVEHQWERKRNSFEYWATIFHKPWQQAILKKIAEEQKEIARAEGRRIPESDIPLYYYYEKGMPRNAMKGRYAIITEQGKMLTNKVLPNPHYYRPAKSPEERKDYLLGRERGELNLHKGPAIAKLPINMLTDVEVDDRVYGRSFLYYGANGQDIINRLDEVTLNNIKAFGSAKIVIAGGGEIQTESLDDDSFLALKVNNPGGVYPLSRPGSMPDMSSMRASLKDGGDGVAGLNEASYGNMQRETSGTSMQTAAAQANQVRRRLFNKYTAFCESVYKSLMMISRERWEEKKALEILGANGKYSMKYVSSLDIDGGYAYTSSYGENFSLDPAMRRQEIQTILPILQEQNAITPQQVVELLGLNEVKITHDILRIAEDYQKRIFERIKETGKQVEIDAELEEHDAMLVYARQYILTPEFELLDDTTKKLIKGHIKARMKAIASQAPQAPQGQEGPQQAAPGAPPPQLPQ